MMEQMKVLALLVAAAAVAKKQLYLNVTSTLCMCVCVRVWACACIFYQSCEKKIYIYLKEIIIKEFVDGYSQIPSSLCYENKRTRNSYDKMAELKM